MRKTLTSTLLFALLLLLGTSCGTTKITLGQPFQLKLGETAQLKGAQPTQVTFTEVVSDSRCPKNANCFWAGEAKLLLQINGSATEFTLPGLSDEADQRTISPYSYQVNALLPYPDASENEENTKPEPSSVVEVVVQKL